jgi:hypothetical protein
MYFCLNKLDLGNVNSLLEFLFKEHCLEKLHMTENFKYF